MKNHKISTDVGGKNKGLRWNSGQACLYPGLAGQASIEVTLGLVACFMFFLCTIQLFLWINRCMVERQWADGAYEKTRIQAGGYATGKKPEPGKSFQDDNPNTETWTPANFIPD